MCRPFTGAAEWYICPFTRIVIVNANPNPDPNLNLIPMSNISSNFRRSSKWTAHSAVEFPAFEIFFKIDTECLYAWLAVHTVMALWVKVKVRMSGVMIRDFVLNNMIMKVVKFQ